MRVRTFELVNEKGQVFSLMDINEGCIFKEPSGFGYSYESTFEKIGNTFIETLRKLNQPNIDGNLEFKNYDNFRRYIDFIEASSQIKWKCIIPYISGKKTYFKDVSFKSIDKSDIFTEEDKLIVPVSFNCLSLWYEEKNIEYEIEPMQDEFRWNFYWNSYFNDRSYSNIEYVNEGHIEAPVQLEIDGAISNPKIEMLINGSVCQTISIKANILEYEKLFYNSKENQFEISKIKTDGTKEKLFKWGVINFENEDIVLRIPKNKSCEIRLSADNPIKKARLTIFPQYKCV